MSKLNQYLEMTKSDIDPSVIGDYIRKLKEEFGKYGAVVFKSNTIKFKGPKVEEGNNHQGENLTFIFDISDMTLTVDDNGETVEVENIEEVIKYVKSGTID